MAGRSHPSVIGWGRVTLQVGMTFPTLTAAEAAGPTRRGQILVVQLQARHRRGVWVRGIDEASDEESGYFRSL